MGVDFFPCSYCGYCICDCGEYSVCTTCEYSFCNDVCGDIKSNDDISGYTTCRYCRYEDIKDDIALELFYLMTGETRTDMAGIYKVIVKPYNEINKAYNNYKLQYRKSKFEELQININKILEKNEKLEEKYKSILELKVHKILELARKE